MGKEKFLITKNQQIKRKLFLKQIKHKTKTNKMEQSKLQKKKAITIKRYNKIISNIKKYNRNKIKILLILNHLLNKMKKDKKNIK